MANKTDEIYKIQKYLADIVFLTLYFPVPWDPSFVSFLLRAWPKKRQQNLDNLDLSRANALRH